MKRKKPYLLAGLVLLLFLLCTACGNTEGQIAPQDDPNEGLGGGLSEDTVNDFSGFEGIWLGGADNDYDSMEFDAEGNWTLYLSGEVVDDGYLRYEPEWEAIYAYSSSDDSGSLIAMEDGQLYSAAYGYFNYGEGMEYLWYEDGGHLTEDDEPDPSLPLMLEMYFHSRLERPFRRRPRLLLELGLRALPAECLRV